jgi:5-methylthioribose kinase
MELLTADNLSDYLRERDRSQPGGEAVSGPYQVEELSGGVSNAVFRVRPATSCGPDDESGDFIVKQARPQLRTAALWLCTVERIWREIDVLAACGSILESHAASPSDTQFSVPRLLWADRERYAYAMSAAPRAHRTWKQALLAGEVDPTLATACGVLLGRLHAGSAEQLGDRTLFDELRLEPYYRVTARACPEAAPHLAELVESAATVAHCLVHADFSPKNLLVWPGQVMLVDFETGHFGDPAFDLGFFLTHLVLKAHWAAGENSAPPVGTRVPAAEVDANQRRAVRHLAACIWARLDGTSKIEYLAHPLLRDTARRTAFQLLQTPPPTLAEALALCETNLASACDKSVS